MNPWWKEIVFYEIYVPSFFDSNNDGIGDLKGICQKLDYIEELGVEGIWLTPFYSSPKVDNGYDIADYYQVDADYGDMNDFEKLIKATHDRGIKVIVDMVLNHTSNQHQWFQESKESKDNKKRDWYIWEPPSKNGGPPNNWESFFGGSAWEYDAVTDEYYYHAFAKEQVDLNWSNEEVKEAVFNVLRFWLDKGVDGFRLDVINFLTLNRNFFDNPTNNAKEQEHLYDKDQEGIFEVINEIVAITKEYGDKFVLGEVGSEEFDLLEKYLSEAHLDAVFNFNLGSIETLDDKKVFSEMKKMDAKLAEANLPTLFFGSHDMSRHYSRFGNLGNEEKIARLTSTFLLTAKGIPFLYFGEEIGMQDFIAKNIEEIKDVQGSTAYNIAKESGYSNKEALKRANKQNRDKSRTPMQWKNKRYLGFSQTKPWLTCGDSSNDSIVDLQIKDEQSLLAHYHYLIQLRKNEPALQFGNYQMLNYENSIISYIRKFEQTSFMIILNFADDDAEYNLHDLGEKKIELVYSSQSLEMEEGSVLGSFTILPYEAIVIKMNKEAH